MYTVEPWNMNTVKHGKGNRKPWDPPQMYPQIVSWLCFTPRISKNKSEIVTYALPGQFHHRRGIGLLSSDLLCAARSSQ
jgi:hypothetical protein